MEKRFASLRQLDRHGSEQIRVYPNHQADDYPAHWHMKYEIILPVEESYSAEVDNRRYEILPGEVLIIPSGVVHEIFAPDQGLRYIIMVNHEVIYATEGLGGMQHLFYPCVHLRPGQGMPENAVEYLWQAIREHADKNLLAQAAVTAWVRLFLIHVGRALFRSNAENQSEHRHQMNGSFLDIYAYITEHCSEKLTLEGVAAYSGYSKYHFSRIFKEHTGMSFYDFYLRQRLLLCRQLLSEMSLPITEVASRSGFGSLATFNRVFKQYEGVTPTQYRQLWQQRQVRVPHDTPPDDK
ncbi:MAG: helix-turn-helix transcriptional regulator [Clostridia bacterium]|nr:helix-turn-helix transcriptional regulator [Clostridia bacterium]